MTKAILILRCFALPITLILTAKLSDPVSVDKFKIGETYLLRISMTQDSSHVTYSAGGSLKPFTSLKDKAKIDLIGKLLQLEGDTSTCNHKVACYWPQYYRGDYPKAKQYELQVEALYMINFIAFTDIAFPYSPFPVLYDSVAKKEITKKSKALREIFALYKKWFEKLRQIGFNNYTYPLNDSKYKWFGGKNRKIIFPNYPYWGKNAAGEIEELN